MENTQVNPLNSSTLDNAANPTASTQNPDQPSPPLLKRIEIWIGRLAMFSVTTILTAIALTAHS
ncbi:MAG: hypothetical protein MUF49_20530 [Oculatellaceae cyanobacterium Prado106]|nr:hypothetical protein [Oculatellaceae cyanobacterium Prado106]